MTNRFTGFIGQCPRVLRFAWLLTLLTLPSLAESTEPHFSNGRADFSFGHRQLEQVLADRPDMKHVLPDDYTIKWLVDSFNGDRCGSRVYWIADSPRSGAPSQFSSPYQGVPAMVRVSAGTEVTPLDKWAALIFEFHNLSGSKRFVAAAHLAYNGRITGEEYAMECVKLEFQAMQKAAQFFEKHPLPQGIDSNDQLYGRLLQVPSSFEEYQTEFAASKSSCGNYDYFKEYYDDTIAPAIIHAGWPVPEGFKNGTKQLEKANNR